ncbi:MAG: hypothetical protein Aurels2KO_52050 [Aureliella sp.]
MSSIDATPQWVSGFRESTARRGIAGFNGSHVSVLSDFSGLGRYQTLSFLVFEQSQSPDWPRLRYELRQKFPDNRRIKFSNLKGNQHLSLHLESILSVADSLHGWCVTIAIHDSIRNLVTDEHTLEHWNRIANLNGNWKAKQFENVLRIVHFLALILADMIGESESVEWVCDQDDIFANDSRCNDVAKLLQVSLSSYAPSARARILIGTSEIDTGHRGIEDLLSIADLSAGAVGEWATSRITRDTLSPRSNAICNWLASNDGSLSKCTIEFRPTANNMFEIRQLDAELVENGK